jgi:hypothetical protein
MNNSIQVINGLDEINYIHQRYPNLSKHTITYIMNTYYNLVDYTHKPNPEDHYSTIASVLNINNSIIIDIFNIQLDFLYNQGLVFDIKS